MTDPVPAQHPEPGPQFRERHLDPGERILWQGSPLPGIRNVRRRVLTSLLGVGALAYGIVVFVIEFPAAISEQHFGVAAFCIFFGFVCFGGGLHYSVFQWRDAARAHLSTSYTLTNRCAYVSVGSGYGSLNSYLIRPDTALELDRRDGYDDLWLHVGYKHPTKEPATTERIGFEGLPDGEKVLMLIRDIQAGQA